MRWSVLMTVLAFATGAQAGGNSHPLDKVSTELMAGKAEDWRRANDAVKDRVGDLVFDQRNFPRKSEMNADDMIACIDDIALKSEPGRPVETMIGECGGVYGEVD